MVVNEIVKSETGWEERVRFEKIGEREAVLGIWGFLRGILTRGGQEWRWWTIGVSVEDFVSAVRASDGLGKRQTGALTLGENAETISTLLRGFIGEQYIPWLDMESGNITIALKKGAAPRDQLKAVLHASTAFSQLRKAGTTASVDVAAHLVEGRQQIAERWDGICKTLDQAGWDLESVNLEDGIGKRLEIQEDKVKG